jgi:hypothetical protein
LHHLLLLQEQRPSLWLLALLLQQQQQQQVLPLHLHPSRLCCRYLTWQHQVLQLQICRMGLPLSMWI